MDDFVVFDQTGAVAIIRLNRPHILNAWHGPMREMLCSTLERAEASEDVRAIVLTGTGERSFCAGQDLNETKAFSPERSGEWVREWERLYGIIRSLSKPLVIALNGLAAGSGFQVALLGDFRIGHPGLTMGQPEINAGIASTTGPWIMREILGLARTIDLTLTGRMMDADECFRIGVINRLVPQERVMAEAMALAEDLASKPPVAMRLNKARFKEVTEPGFCDCIAAGVRNQRIAYATGEPARMMEKFLAERAARKRARG